MKLNEYETFLRTGTLLERHGYALELVKCGKEGIEILARLSVDTSLSEGVRIPAFRHIPTSYREELLQSVPVLLKDSSASLRVWAIKKAEGAGLVEIVDQIACLLDDKEEYYDLDELISVREVANKALDTLCDL